MIIFERDTDGCTPKKEKHAKIAIPFTRVETKVLSYSILRVLSDEGVSSFERIL